MNRVVVPARQATPRLAGSILCYSAGILEQSKTIHGGARNREGIELSSRPTTRFLAPIDRSKILAQGSMKFPPLNCSK